MQKRRAGVGVKLKEIITNVKLFMHRLSTVLFDMNNYMKFLKELELQQKIILVMASLSNCYEIFGIL